MTIADNTLILTVILSSTINFFMYLHILGRLRIHESHSGMYFTKLSRENAVVKQQIEQASELSNSKLFALGREFNDFRQGIATRLANDRQPNRYN